MKEYKIILPDRLKGKEVEIKEYLVIQQWEDNIVSSGACAKLLGVEKFVFQDEILGKHGLSYMS